MKFTKGTLLIETKIPNENKDETAKIICDWADKYKMYVCFGYDERGEYLCEYEKEGRTQLFCKGCVAELKDLIKVSFNAKITVLFEAY